MRKYPQHPTTQDKAKVPMVMQLEELECGAACLTMVLGYYGRFVPLSQMRADCGVSRDGCSAANLILTARRYGLVACGFRKSVDTLKEEKGYPRIIFWEHNHFVVLTGYRNGKFFLNDPGRGEVALSEEEFRSSYSKICLTFEPGEGFEQGGKPESVRDYVQGFMGKSKQMIAFVLVTTFLLTVIGVVDPIFSRVYVDSMLTGIGAIWWRRAFIGAFAIIAVIKVVLSWMQQSSLTRMRLKLAIGSNSAFMWHVLHLPMNFFSQRSVGELVNRKRANSQIANTVIMQYTPIVLDVLAMVLYFVLMVVYSPLLAIIGVLSIALNMFITFAVNKRRLNIMRRVQKHSAQYATDTMVGVQMIETIQAAGVEDGYFSKWSASNAEVTSANSEAAMLDSYIGLLPGIVSMLTSSLILCIGVLFIMQGNWTVGIVSAFTGYLAAFNRPVVSLISAIGSFQQVKTEVERIKDVMEYESVPMEDYTGDDDSNVPEQNVPEQIAGQIEFKNVSFGYNPHLPPLINDFDMVVEPGKSVAFVGGSGSGKSTLAKLLCNLYQPWQGEIHVDGVPVRDIPHNVFAAIVSSVDQEISLFADSISNNIKLWDPSIEDSAVMQGARDAEVHDDIMDRPYGYATKLQSGGSNLSGGQRQRIEIARALAKSPQILVMDEATSALDARTEELIMKKIRERGITLVIISHRLSTIRDCDEIVVLKSGNVIDRGTHEALLERCEYYRDMISNE